MSLAAESAPEKLHHHTYQCATRDHAHRGCHPPRVLKWPRARLTVLRLASEEDWSEETK